MDNTQGMDTFLQSLNIQSIQNSTPVSSPETQGMDTFLQSQSTQSNPDDVSKAINDTGDQSYDGDCERFVENMVGTPFAPSAIDAWNTFSQNGQAIVGTNGVKPGDILYFSPNDSNQGYGHAGIYMGENKFISATDNGVMPYDLNDWQNLTGQSILGYIPQGGQNGRN